MLGVLVALACSLAAAQQPQYVNTAAVLASGTSTRTTETLRPLTVSPSSQSYNLLQFRLLQDRFARVQPAEALSTSLETAVQAAGVGTLATSSKT